MSQDEVIDNLGTIARSGTKKFLEALSGDSAKDAQLIGQFGVGFYSAFIVADNVTVLTKRADAPAVRWDSDGEGPYEIQSSDKPDRGTEVIMHLREEDKEFLEAARLRQLVRKYSDHLSIPIVSEDRRAGGDAQSSQGVLDPPQIGSQGRGLSGLLQAHHARFRGCARLGAQQGRRQHRIHLAVVSAEARAVRFVRARTAAAACSCTSSASSSWTRPRSCCRHTCASCADWSIRPICRSMCRASCCRTIAPWRRSSPRW